MMKFFKKTPTFLLALSTITSVTSNNVLMMWVTLELSSVSFIVMISTKEKKEKILVFFVFQSLATMVLLMYMMNSNTSLMKNFTETMLNMVLIAMFMKIGLYPFHSWMVEMSKHIKWLSLLVLFTWQKVIPILLILKTPFSSKVKNMIILFTWVMSMIMMKTSNMKKIMSLSSLIHMNWLMIPMKIFKLMSIMYLTVYSLVLTPTFILMLKSNFKTNSFQNSSKKSKNETLLMLVSLAGVPPSLMFMLKILIMYFLMKMNNDYKVMTLLFISSCLSFFVYFQVFMKNTMKNKTNWKKQMTMNKNKKTFFLWTTIMIPMAFFYM